MTYQVSLQNLRRKSKNQWDGDFSIQQCLIHLVCNVHSASYYHSENLINIFTEMDFDLLFFKSRNAIKSITAEMDTS